MPGRSCCCPRRPDDGHRHPSDTGDDRRPPRSARLPRRRDRRPQAPEPVPAAARDVVAAGPRDRPRRPPRHQPLVERLPRPDAPPADEGGGRSGPSSSTAPARARSARSSGRCRSTRSSRPSSPTFKHTEAVLTFQSGLHLQHRRDPGRDRRAGPDPVGLAQPRLDHRRDAPLQGAAEGVPAQGRRRPPRTPARGGATRAAPTAPGRTG